MADVIQNLIHSVLGDGQRASKFTAIINAPGCDSNALNILCKVASIPGRSVESIDFKFHGKSIPVPSQEKFSQSLEVTFYLEDGHASRVAFDTWIWGLTYDQYESGPKRDIVGQLELKPLDFDGVSPMGTYTFYNVFPQEIGSATLDASQVDTIVEYTVNFSYTHYTASGGSASGGGGGGGSNAGFGYSGGGSGGGGGNTFGGNTFGGGFSGGTNPLSRGVDPYSFASGFSGSNPISGGNSFLGSALNSSTYGTMNPLGMRNPGLMANSFSANRGSNPYGQNSLFNNSHGNNSLANQVLNGVAAPLNKVVGGAIGAITESLGLGRTSQNIVADVVGDLLNGTNRTVNKIVGGSTNAITQSMGFGNSGYQPSYSPQPYLNNVNSSISRGISSGISNTFANFLG